MTPAAVVRLGSFAAAAAELGYTALREREQGKAHAMLLRDEIDLAITFDYEHAPAPVPAGLVQEHLMDDPILGVLL